MCGLFAWSSTNKENWTPLSRFKFELLGVEMDARGGDGCGVAYDGSVSKSVELKKFDEFWRTNCIPYELKRPMIIGHDRKASVGEKTLANTQPICFDFKDAETNCILAHNGTLYNHKELYEKHKLEVHYDETDIKTMSDSQVLALLLERVGWTILEEYTGSVAMMYMSEKTPNEFYIYHGRSSMRKFAAASEERPLYYVVDGEELWLCSTRTALEKIVSDKASIQEVPFNKVLRVSGNTITEVVDVNRDKAYQVDEKVVVTTYGRNSIYGNWDEGYADEALPSRWNKSSSTKEKRTYKLSDDVAFGKYKDNLFWEAGFFKATPNSTPAFLDARNNLNGLVHVNMGGKLFDAVPSSMSTTSYNLYFFHGNLCKGRDEYQECLTVEAGLSGKTTRSQLFCLLGGNFVFPFVIPEVDGGDGKMYSNKIASKRVFEGHTYDFYEYYYTGVVNAPARAQRLIFRDGDLSDVSSESYNSLYDLRAYSDQYPEEFEEWLARFTAKSNAPIVEKLDKFTCPDCDGHGEFISGQSCVICAGTGKISLDQLEAEIAKLEEASSLISIESEEMKYLVVIKDIVTNGIEVLEEPDIVQQSTFALDKLNKIKEIIEG